MSNYNANMHILHTHILCYNIPITSHLIISPHHLTPMTLHTSHTIRTYNCTYYTSISTIPKIIHGFYSYAYIIIKHCFFIIIFLKPISFHHDSCHPVIHFSASLLPLSILTLPSYLHPPSYYIYQTLSVSILFHTLLIIFYNFMIIYF